MYKSDSARQMGWLACWDDMNIRGWMWEKMVSMFALVVGASHDHGCATMCGVDAPDIAMQGFLVLKEIVLAPRRGRFFFTHMHSPQFSLLGVQL